MFTFEFRRYVMWLSSSCDVFEGSDYNSAKGGNHCEEFDVLDVSKWSSMNLADIS
jgi:hypothetical protein